ncbi:LysR family transcriptional regulator [Pusillimonas sp. SM2304]|uniref:LysR family transcriptional regulator n=1 Tax=Pusillimonas sp. SM2304 TaxID=3073241 RepID=UPI002874584C|nr:LysR family transcriptional regulator [Pusillimonas sp. SM2304]MDS1140584.1 LysR family transcriptional regulator [Pusillimonas sp. SM2304]
MSSIRFMRTFVAIARLGSFSEAAESVGLTQAAVSLQMRSLEEEFGRVLFDRSGRLALLNAAGQELLPEVKALLEHYDRIRQPRPPAGQFVGQVTIGAIVSSMSILAKIVSQLKEEHKELGIRLVSGKSSELTHKVVRGELDAALVVGTGRRYPGSRWTMLYQEPLAIITHASMRTRNPQDILARHPFLRFDRSQHTGRQIDRVLQQMGIVPDDFLELNAIEQLLGLVRHDVGVTILPLLNTLQDADLSDLRVVPLPAALGSPTRDIGMIERRDNRQQAITQELFEQYAAMLLR